MEEPFLSAEGGGKGSRVLGADSATFAEQSQAGTSSHLSQPVFLCVLTIHSLEQLRVGQNSRAESERKGKQVKEG